MLAAVYLLSYGSKTIAPTGNVITSIEGNYTLTYTAPDDLAGNAGPTITRNVRILDLPPLEILEGFSVTPAGTWTDGVRIANPTHVSTFQIGTATYAGISSDKGLAIINITDIGSPAHVSFINDVADASIASFEPRSTTFVSIDGSTYALSPYSTSMAIIKVSNSGSLSTVSAVTDGSGTIQN